MLTVSFDGAACGTLPNANTWGVTGRLFETVLASPIPANSVSVPTTAAARVLNKTRVSRSPLFALKVDEKFMLQDFQPRTDLS
jgi:hypothetical protein